MTTVEQVGVVPREDCEQLGLLEHGLHAASEQALGLLEEKLHFMARPMAEEDPSHKQLIPYVLVRSGDQLFGMRRLSSGGEARLHGKLSLGVGGHMNPVDRRDGHSAVRATLMRELEEELCIPAIASERFVGVINDDTSAVGSVHLGIVFQVEVDSPESVTVRETDALDGRWYSRQELEELRGHLETWSVFLLDWISGAHGVTAP
ncbi:MAG: NUDIX domain-containing protein [Myxococcales bacterium]|nr:NUDIX domain-containing protein [Myxococcales bacterium]